MLAKADQTPTIETGPVIVLAGACENFACEFHGVKIKGSGYTCVDLQTPTDRRRRGSTLKRVAPVAAAPGPATPAHCAPRASACVNYALEYEALARLRYSSPPGPGRVGRRSRVSPRMHMRSLSVAHRELCLQFGSKSPLHVEFILQLSELGCGCCGVAAFAGRIRLHRRRDRVARKAKKRISKHWWPLPWCI